MPILDPFTFRISLFDALSSSFPWNLILPPLIMPGGVGTSPIIDWKSHLYHSTCTTIEATSPLQLKETSRTAFTSPPYVLKLFLHCKLLINDSLFSTSYLRALGSSASCIPSPKALNPK